MQKLEPSQKWPCSPATLQNPADEELERSFFFFFLLTVVMHDWMIYGQEQQPHPYLKVINHQKKDSAQNHSEEKKASESESV